MGLLDRFRRKHPPLSDEDGDVHGWVPIPPRANTPQNVPEGLALFVLMGSNAALGATRIIQLNSKSGPANNVTVTLVPGGWVNVPGSIFDSILMPAVVTGLIVILSDMDGFACAPGVNVQQVSGASGSGTSLPVIDDLGSAPFPIVIPLDAIAETEIGPGAAETWALDTLDQAISAALAGTVTFFMDAGETQFSKQITLAPAGLVQALNGVQIPPNGVIVVNITAAGAANTRMTISGRRIA